jgi:hypothetical protein
MRFLFVLAILFLGGCSPSDNAFINAIGKDQKITLYSNDGKVIRSFTSVSVPEVKEGGYEFKDKTSGKWVSIRGTIVVETLAEEE